MRRWIVGIGTVTAVASPVPRQASSPAASCIGQQLSVYGPAFGADLGAAVSYEARNPEVLGTSNLGGWTNVAARSARGACPVD
jgi:hypothetical protein